MTTDVAVPDSGIFSEKGLSLPANTSYEEWEAQGNTLALMHASLPFWIGDWRNFGEAAFGQRSFQVTLPGVKAETEITYAWVSRRIEFRDRRVPDLSFSHHRLVAALPRRERNSWLAKAVKERMTTRDLRAELLARTLDTGAEAAAVTPPPPVAEAPVPQTGNGVAIIQPRVICCPECGHAWEP